ncbi:hypothetical protein DVH24_034100, partial [Malus domestica]
RESKKVFAVEIGSTTTTSGVTLEQLLDKNPYNTDIFSDPENYVNEQIKGTNQQQKPFHDASNAVGPLVSFLGMTRPSALLGPRSWWGLIIEHFSWQPLCPFVGEIFSCDKNISSTLRVLIRVHTYPTICIVTRNVSSCVTVTLTNLSLRRSIFPCMATTWHEWQTCPLVLGRCLIKKCSARLLIRHREAMGSLKRSASSFHAHWTCAFFGAVFICPYSFGPIWIRMNPALTSPLTPCPRVLLG